MNKWSIHKQNKFFICILLILIIGVLTSCGAQDTNSSEPATGNATSTAAVLCDLSESGYNSNESVKLDYSYTWSCSDSERSLTANGVPDSEVGTFPNEANPNTISAQNVSAAFTLTPIETNTATALGGPLGAIAIALNGVKFDPGTGGTCDDTGANCDLGRTVGQWRIEALSQSYFNFGTDQNNAHVQPDGTYHYHGMPENFLTQLGDNKAMTLVGWAADGFPVYARYGYSDANDATSDIKVIKGSYQTKEAPDEGRPSTELYAMGTFGQDWEYVEGSGDLDECNGRMGVTPEFPEGIYHYYATDSYPFMSRCVKGEVSSSGGPGGPPAGAEGGPPNFAAAAQTLGLTEEVLRNALDGPPPNFEEAAQTLGIPLETLQNALAAPNNAGSGN